MSGVWVFKNGVATLVQAEDIMRGGQVLVYLPTNQIISSYEELKEKLSHLGWLPYPTHHHHNSTLLQFHKGHSSAHLITLPRDFRRFRSVHMFDIVLKNREFFQVRDHYNV